MQQVERWKYFEFAMQADVSKLENPFTQAKVKVRVEGPDGARRLDGFYAGGGRFAARYMPGHTGVYTLTVKSNLPELNGARAQFEAVPAAADNHGPAVADGAHFRYADGARLFVMGTTAYVWHHRPQSVRERTLESFSKYGFNKIRMLFFPKHYTGSYGKIDVSYEPPCYPFEGEKGRFDFSRPNPAYFDQFEDRLRELDARGIMADVILFHPYDFGHWDIDYGMDEDDALFYLRYIVARLSAFKNVWWSLANEYDVVMGEDRKTMRVGDNRRDWDVIGELIRARDPSGHPISCHNISFGRIYPDRHWMSHVSYQHPDAYALMLELKAAYRKPVIDDEYQYEGNTPDDWGNSPAGLEVERHWLSVMAGGYATHGEALIRDGNNRDIFWAYGGEMTGQSAPRLRFLKQIVMSVPFERMERNWINTDGRNYFCLSEGDRVYLVFVREDMPGKQLWLGAWAGDRAALRYRARVYDAWQCKLLSDRVIGAGDAPPLRAWNVMVLEKIEDQ